MEVKLPHPLNAPASMAVTSSGILVFWHPTSNVPLAVLIMALQLFRESYIAFPPSTVIEVKQLQL